MSLYYIDTNSGSDSNDGSIGSPWETINKANNNVSSGDTVFIRGGTYYNESISPGVSGADGNEITYKNYGTETVIFTDGGGSEVPAIDLANRSYVIVDGIEVRIWHGFWVNFSPNGQHNTIQNCVMEESDKYTGMYIWDNANYNKILNNVVTGLCRPKDPISIRNSHHVLVEGNEIYYGSHTALPVQDTEEDESNYIVIRNNIVQNKWHSNLSLFGVDYMLVEGNTILDAGEKRAENSCGSEDDRTAPRSDHKGIMLNGTYSVVRNNICINNGVGIGMSSTDSDSDPWKTINIQCRYYNNTLHANYIGMRSNTEDYIQNAVVKNNIITDSTDDAINVWDGTVGATIDYINNNIYNNGGSTDYGTLGVIEGTLAVNPLYVNKANRDLQLQETSPMINAGAFLTTTTSAGSGKIIPVDDARYFISGWEIIENDSIQFEGQTSTAKIVSINYATNTITVDTDMTWANNLGVSLPYYGTAPDIGALQYISEALPNLSPTGQVTSNPSPVQNDTTVAHVLGTATPGTGRSISSVAVLIGSGSVTGTTSWDVTCNLAVGANYFVIRITDDEGDTTDVSFLVERNSPATTVSKAVAAYIKGGKLF